jgi:hypothetical protein
MLVHVAIPLRHIQFDRKRDPTLAPNAPHYIQCRERIDVLFDCETVAAFNDCDAARNTAPVKRTLNTAWGCAGEKPRVLAEQRLTHTLINSVAADLIDQMKRARFYNRIIQPVPTGKAAYNQVVGVGG